MKRSIRLDETLIKNAETVGSGVKRSIASQVEYWAELGRAQEKINQPSRADLNTLKNFNSNFMDQIQRDVKSGNVRKENLKTGYAFEKSKMGPGFVDKVFKDETRITGRVVNGEFVEVQGLGDYEEPIGEHSKKLADNFSGNREKSASKVK